MFLKILLNLKKNELNFFQILEIWPSHYEDKLVILYLREDFGFCERLVLEI